MKTAYSVSISKLPVSKNKVLTGSALLQIIRVINVDHQRSPVRKVLALALYTEVINICAVGIFCFYKVVGHCLKFSVLVVDRTWADVTGKTEKVSVYSSPK